MPGAGPASVPQSMCRQPRESSGPDQAAKPRHSWSHQGAKVWLSLTHGAVSFTWSERRGIRQRWSARDDDIAPAVMANGVESRNHRITNYLESIFLHASLLPALCATHHQSSPHHHHSEKQNPAPHHTKALALAAQEGRVQVPGAPQCRASNPTPRDDHPARRAGHERKRGAPCVPCRGSYSSLHAGQ